MSYINEKLNRMMITLNQAIHESETAVNDPQKSYPYAAGYARSALKMILNDVKDLQELIDTQEAQLPDDSYIMDNDFDDSM